MKKRLLIVSALFFFVNEVSCKSVSSNLSSAYSSSPDEGMLQILALVEMAEDSDVAMIVPDIEAYGENKIFNEIESIIRSSSSVQLKRSGTIELIKLLNKFARPFAKNKTIELLSRYFYPKMP